VNALGLKRKLAEWHNMCADRAHAGVKMWVGTIPPVKWVNRVAPVKVSREFGNLRERQKEKETMKRLMITAAAAAMVSGAFAIGKAQVYDFTATIKTGICKEAKVSKALENYFNHGGLYASVNFGYTQGEEIGLRKQQSMKLGGVIWGCDCDTIARPYWGHPRGLPSRYLSGYMFWNLTADMLYWPFSWANPTQMVTTFDWQVLNRIDTMSKCEGMFVLRARWPGQQLTLQGAGFGSVKNTGCDTYINSINGNIVGWRFTGSESFGCVFCAANGCVVGLICDSCLERALGMDTRLWTAATGTWKLKYNASVSKKLSKTPFISKVYKFPKTSGLAAEFATVADRVNAFIEGLRYGQTIVEDEYEEGDFEDKAAFEDYDPEELPESLTTELYSLGSEIVDLTLEDAIELELENMTEEEQEAIEAFEAFQKAIYSDSEEDAS
jgi:hypothetical protein